MERQHSKSSAEAFGVSKSRPMEPRRAGLRVITIGATSVGKSCLLACACGTGIHGITSTTNLNTMRKDVVLDNGSVVQLDLWDTAGQEAYRALNQMYFRNAQVALACFDRQRQPEIETWISELVRAEPSCRIMLVLTKADLLDEKEIDEVRLAIDPLLSEGGNRRFFVTSAVQRRGIDDLFKAVAEVVHTLPNLISEEHVYDLAETPSRCAC
jgi:small GTP-binding protein